MKQQQSIHLCLVVGLLALGAMCLVGINLGAFSLSPRQVWAALLEHTGSQGYIVWELRLPRVLVAALIGSQLALAGALLQTVLRNPLVDPSIMGVSGGASLAAVSLLLFGGRVGVSTSSAFAILPVIALVGGGAAAALVYYMAWSGGTAPQRLVLCGIGLSSVLQLLVAAIFAGWGQGRVEGMLIWVAGSLYAADWHQIPLLAMVTLVGCATIPWLSRPISLLALSDHRAIGLGLSVETYRIAAIVVAVVLASVAVAMAGPVGFIGLVVPHMVRQLVGAAPQRVLAISPLAGGFLGVAADTLGRAAFVPHELPVGVVSAIIGVPFFLFQLRRSGR